MNPLTVIVGVLAYLVLSGILLFAMMNRGRAWPPVDLEEDED